MLEIYGSEDFLSLKGSEINLSLGIEGKWYAELCFEGECLYKGSEIELFLGRMVILWYERDLGATFLG